MPFLPNAIAKIYRTTDLINPVWIGFTDANGRAIDAGGVPPSLQYGDYIITLDHCDYNLETLSFNIPRDTLLAATVGCTSSITTHETVYDHSKISTSNDIMHEVVPSISGFDISPSPLNELTNHGFDDFITSSTIRAGQLSIKEAYITYNFGSLKEINYIILNLKYRMYGSGLGQQNTTLSILGYNGTGWVELWSDYYISGQGFDTGIKEYKGTAYPTNLISSLQLYFRVQGGGNVADNANIILYGKKILAFI